MTGAVIAINLVLGLLDRAAAVSNVIKNAQSEGRDVTNEELDKFFADDDAARTALDAAIKKAREGG